MSEGTRARRFGRAFTGVVVFFALAGLILAASAGAENVEQLMPLTPAPSAETGEATNETPSLWFVELNSAPSIDGTSSAALRSEKAAFRSAAKQAKLSYTERYAFSSLWNGFSISIGSDQLGKLSRIPGVTALYPVGTETVGPEDVTPDLSTAITMTGADIAQNDLGLTGAGVKVGVVDTGLDYDHPDLGGDGTARSNSTAFPTARVIAGHDFAGDSYNADPTSADYNPTPTPDGYPDDCAGHGTHVSGIIGANGNTATGGARGVAPGVKFGAYRVFGCAGSANDDVILAALEQADADGMDIINMSLGDAFNNWPQAPLAQASDRLVNHGVVVVASIGNSGANGLYSAGAPGVGKKVIGVASFDNSFVHLPSFTVTPAGVTAGYTNATAAPPAPLSGSLPLAKTGTPTTTNDGCAVAGALPDLTGKAVLIRRGTCGFYEKSRRAQLAGASAVVLYNNVAGRVSPTVAVVAGVADGQPVTIPVVAVSDTEGVAINNAIASGPQTLNWQATTLDVPNATGGLISSFSSYGLGAELDLKPDIGAPGGLIRSTWPLEAGGYNTISGTSMASPHVAGAVALLLEAKPHTSSQDVRSILQNNAVPKPWWGNPGLGLLDNVHRQGAGMLRIDRAVLATTSVTPGKLALGESQAGPATRTLTIENDGGSDQTYALSDVQALATGPNTFTPAFFSAPATVSFAQAGAPVTSVLVPAGGTATVDATITVNPALADKSLYGGYIVLTSASDTIRVPYAGFKGDYQSIQVLTPTAGGLPLLSRTGLVSGKVPPASSTFTMADAANMPKVLVHLDHQARRLRIEVQDTSGKSWHRALDLQYLSRNSTSTNFNAYTIDGTTVAGNKTYTLPNGTYTLTLSVQKALGGDGDWETWTSPAFTIARP